MNRWWRSRTPICTLFVAQQQPRTGQLPGSLGNCQLVARRAAENTQKDRARPISDLDGCGGPGLTQTRNPLFIHTTRLTFKIAGVRVGPTEARAVGRKWEYLP